MGPGNHVTHPQRRVHVGPALAVVPQLHGGAHVTLPGHRLDAAGQDFQQGGLAGPVGPHHTQALPVAQRQVHAFKQWRLTGPGVGNTMQLDHLVAQTRRVGVAVHPPAPAARGTA